MSADKGESSASSGASVRSPAPSGRSHTIEIISALALSLATVLAAWSAFQSAKWSGVQSIRFSQAAALRTESVRASTTAGQEVQIDVSLFSQWLNAYSAKDTPLADFYFERFRAEFKPALKAWLATKPLKNPGAPASPFVMPEYKLAAAAKADNLRNRADERASLAQKANQNADNYVLLTVLFASTLLFAGLAPKFVATGVQSAMIALALVLMFSGIGLLVAFPRQL